MIRCSALGLAESVAIFDLILEISPQWALLRLGPRALLDTYINVH